MGTNSLRRARNSKKFLQDVEQILNSKVEVIPGREEARLIYLGVSHSLEDNFDRRLVVDIGGGSTEIVLGRSKYLSHLFRPPSKRVDWLIKLIELNQATEQTDQPITLINESTISS